MSYIDELRKSKEKHQVAFQNFALSTKKYSEHLFCFFEGKDDVYYVSRIRRVTEDFYPIECGGKQSVLDVYALIVNKPEYKKYKLGFFIDRDFNKPIGEKQPPIFETPCYSIENFYVSVNVFKMILVHAFRITESYDEQLFNDLLKLYEERQKEFHDVVLLFNAWYSCLIEKRDNEKIQIGVRLDEKFPNDFIDINLQKVSKYYDFETIKTFFPDAIEIDESILEQKVALFKTVEQHKVFRGKYELEFLLKIIKALLTDSYSHHNILKQKVSFFGFGDGSALNQLRLLAILEAYAETPQELIDYLEIVTKT
ncbi:MAG: DUF4435 domain-containing protein [Planctomycetaceae bacterium]|jgi:hypothetical protein|nr:DUF4435 domain-containing protein [Planctomycetaceae bacterium]